MRHYTSSFGRAGGDDADDMPRGLQAGAMRYTRLLLGTIAVEARRWARSQLSCAASRSRSANREDFVPSRPASSLPQKGLIAKTTHLTKGYWFWIWSLLREMGVSCALHNFTLWFDIGVGR